MRTIDIDIEIIDTNDGQIPGVPKNPREWTYQELSDCMASIRETPEMLEARAPIVYPYEDRYVVIGGNMRFVSCKHLGRKTIPCFVLPGDMDADKICDIALKDNSSFGKWDMTELKKWEGIDFAKWGVSVLEEKEKEEKAPRQPTKTMPTFNVVFSPAEFTFVQQRLAMFGDGVKETGLLRKLGYE